MRFKLRLVVEGDGREAVQEVAVLNKECQRLEQLGLTLAEAKAILRGLQRTTAPPASPSTWS